MPNHVATHVTIKGDEASINGIKELFSKASNTLDFEKIIPMPECMKIDKSSLVMSAQGIIQSSCKNLQDHFDGSGSLGTDDAIIREISPVFQDPDEMMSMPLSELISKVKEAGVLCFLHAEQRISNLKEFGIADWYDWGVSNWGTKWNAYDGRNISESEGELTFEFDTAWGFAEPIFNKLVEMFPKIELEASFIDEGWSFAGVYKYIDGEIEIDEIEPDSDSLRFRDLYQKVYGREIEQDE